MLSNFSGEVFGVIQRSLHDEIVMSLARLFDKEKYNDEKEHLSQRNLVLKYEVYLSEKLKTIRNETRELLEEINIKTYRHAKLAHNDKPTLLGTSPKIKHNITSIKVITLIEKSQELVLGLKAEILKTNLVSIKADISKKYVGFGFEFVNKIKNITK